jgi:hypothetical protein
MKRVLLAVLLLTGFLFTSAQQRDLWFNEMFPDPDQSNNEFIEMYNTSTSDIFLDCYVIVSYAPPNTGRTSANKNQTAFGNGGGVYVYNFPTNAKISALSYYLLASNSPLSFKGGKNVTPPDATKFSNWNTTITGGYLTKYTYSGGTNGTWSNAITPNSFERQDILVGNGTLLLYKINSNGTTTLVNGVFGNSIPSGLSSLANLTIPSSSSCVSGNVTLNFNQQTYNTNTVDFTTISAAIGGDHGYAKVGNGLCGNWVKTTTDNQFTPGVKNPASLGTVNPTLTTTQGFSCGSQIGFTVNSTPATGTNYPVTVLLYIDKDKDSVLDGAIDEYVQTYIANPINSGSNTIYYFTGLASLPTTQQYLVVYRTALGCFDQVRVPAATDLTVTPSVPVFVCNNRLDFTVSGNSTFSVPLEVSLYPKTSMAANGDLQDYNNDGFIDDADTIGTQLGRTVITSMANGSASGSINYTGNVNDFWVIYKPASSCNIILPVAARAAAGQVTTTQPFRCSAIRYTITPSSNAADVSTYTLPMFVGVYYDKNNNGTLDAADTSNLPADRLASTVVTALSSGIATGTLTIADASKLDEDIYIVYYAATACFNPAPQVLKLTRTVTGTIKLGGSIPESVNASGGRDVQYFIVNATTDLDTYPITLNFYEDRERNSLLESGQTPTATHTVNAPSSQDDPDQTFFTSIVNPNSYAIITATSINGCSTAFEVIENQNIILPVHFTSFTAARKGDKVQLKWETATEQNNNGFHVQRNTGGEWKTVAFVFSATENGNSTTANGYTFTDNNPAKGLTQYRLIQEDHDGRVAYSRTVPVQGLQGSSRLVVYPNPSTSGKVTVLFENATSLRDVVVSDIAGRVVKQYRSVADGSLEVGYLLKGFYTIKVTDRTTGATQVEKVIIK